MSKSYGRRKGRLTYMPEEEKIADIRSLPLTELKAALGARKSLLLTGTGETATLETLRGELLKQCPELEIRKAGNVCLDADALESLLNCETVLLAETLQTSRHGAIRRELLRVLESGKDCLGFILLEK